MSHDSSISEDPGTVLGSYPGLPKVALPLPVPAARPIATAVEEVLYASPYRWAAPRIVICDDNTLEEGEVFYVRSEKVVIGRSKGDITIGHDVSMSGIHAEIVRKDIGGKHAWVLRDLGSSNGTFARASRVTLRPGLTIQLGSKRFRFEVPGTPKPSGLVSDDPGTMMIADLSSLPTDVLPALVECSAEANSTAARHPFRATRVSIGRPGNGNNVELDDLCVARVHAVVTRDVSGAWELEAKPSLNGVWVRINAVRLIDNSLFQCGEQRFRFLA